MAFGIIAYMALMSAWAGGSLWPSQYLPRWATWLPEMGFACGLILALYPVIGWWSIAAGIWSYMWMQTGHANALNLSRNANPLRTNTLSPLVKYLAGKLKIHWFTPNYSRLFMAVKGFLITLPIGGLGIVLWPLGYEIGTRAGKHVVSELAAGAGVGVNIVLFTYLAG